jgi:hypothetical protein
LKQRRENEKEMKDIRLHEREFDDNLEKKDEGDEKEKGNEDVGSDSDSGDNRQRSARSMSESGSSEEQPSGLLDRFEHHKHEQKDLDVTGDDDDNDDDLSILSPSSSLDSVLELSSYSSSSDFQGSLESIHHQNLNIEIHKTRGFNNQKKKIKKLEDENGKEKVLIENNNYSRYVEDEDSLSDLNSTLASICSGGSQSLAESASVVQIPQSKTSILNHKYNKNKQKQSQIQNFSDFYFINASSNIDSSDVNKCEKQKPERCRMPHVSLRTHPFLTERFTEDGLCYPSVALQHWREVEIWRMWREHNRKSKEKKK